jgi:hypothetical protein
MGRFADVVVLTAGEGSSSDFGGFRQRQCVIDINTQVSNGVLDFTVSEQQLDRPQVARGLVDEGRLCAAKRMGAVGNLTHFCSHCQCISKLPQAATLPAAGLAFSSLCSELLGFDFVSRWNPLLAARDTG